MLYSFSVAVHALPQTWWLKIAYVYYLTIPRGQESTTFQRGPLLRASGKSRCQPGVLCRRLDSGQIHFRSLGLLAELISLWPCEEGPYSISYELGPLLSPRDGFWVFATWPFLQDGSVLLRGQQEGICNLFLYF